ncbi:MAG: tail fiber protein [Bryobacteraceae bacterium]
MAYIGEIRIYVGVRVPDGWLACDGAALSIAGNEALFNLIGTTYGGDGVNTFNLPNLQSRVGIHMGQGSGLSQRILGQTGGASDVTLAPGDLPPHTHTLQGNTGAPVTQNSGVLAGGLTYGPPGGAQSQMLANATVGFTPATATQPHTNEQPTLAFQYIIAMEGIYPSPGGN